MDKISDTSTNQMTDTEVPSSELPDASSLNGKLLEGRYLITCEIGRGGFGSVYLASDEKVMSKRVVVKVLRRTETQNEWSTKKFKQEIEALARIDHPGIVGILDTGELAAGNPYIVMKYVDGVTVRSCISAQGMNLERAARLIRQIGSALAEAHEKGVLHRDLKPENLMLQTLIGGDEQVTIIDFGVAKIKDSLVAPSTVEPTVSGTQLYMSPEQLRGWKVTAASDIYSMGIIFYEMITGRRPFNPETVAHLAEIQREGVKVRPKDLRPALSENAQDIILKALSFEPKARPQNAREFTKALEESIIGDQEVPTRELHIGRSEEKLLDRHELRASARWNTRTLVVALVVLLLASISAAILWNRLKGSATDGLGSSLNIRVVESVAVLPFANRSTNSDESISDGITESLIDELSLLPSMKVPSRNAVFRFKGKEVDSQIVGRELKVAAVVHGWIARQGADFIISAELVSTQDNRHIWGHLYELKRADILGEEQEISHEIAASLQLRLTNEERPRTKIYTKNNDAYLHYLDGRYFLRKGTIEDRKKAIEYFYKAIVEDPNYALAYAGLADCYSQMDEEPPKDNMQKAQDAALKALDIDDTLAEGHDALGLYMFRYEWDFSGAQREFKRAIELNPNDAQAHYWYHLYFQANEKADEDLAEIKRGQELDPFLGSKYLGDYFLFTTRQYDKAIEEYRKIIEPGADIHAYLRIAFQEKGMFDEAFLEAQKEFASKFSIQQIEEVKRAYAASGYKGLLAEELRLEKERSKREYTSWVLLARICASLGQKDEAFEWLAKAYEAREDGLIWLKADPRYDNLRSDPRFSDLLKRIGLHQ